MQDLEVDVVTPTAQVLKSRGQQVSVPTTEGELTILPGHTWLLATISYGILQLTPAGGGAAERWFLAEGFLEASPDRVVVLAERADPLAMLDAARARASMADAEQRMAKSPTDSAEWAIQEKRRRRAQARLIAIAARDAD